MKNKKCFLTTIIIVVAILAIAIYSVVRSICSLVIAYAFHPNILCLIFESSRLVLTASRRKGYIKVQKRE